MVRLENVAKRYGSGVEVLRSVSVNLEPGGFYLLTGASGAGKSTLLKIIYLAERPTEGKLQLFDTDTADLDRSSRAALRRRIGIVFQGFRLIDDLSVGQNIGLPLRLAGAPERDIQEHGGAILGWLDLRQYADSLPSALSSNEKQRVAIGRAIVGRPDLLIADEPMEHVDDDAALFLIRVFERINELGTTVLVATRDTGFATRFAHPRLHLAQGMLRTDGSLL